MMRPGPLPKASPAPRRAPDSPGRAEMLRVGDRLVVGKEGVTARMWLPRE